ncbi:MAG: hypothetical protein E2P02_12650 [Acidobacteria bacterium]|nr:MAG: hypothetical protein E2P02_12650 [Acidobacteriota bacterium]
MMVARPVHLEDVAESKAQFWEYDEVKLDGNTCEMEREVLTTAEGWGWKFRGIRPRRKNG